MLRIMLLLKLIFFMLFASLGALQASNSPQVPQSTPTLQNSQDSWIQITPKSLLEVGQMNSPLDSQLHPPRTPLPNSYKISTLEALELLEYLSREELYPSKEVQEKLQTRFHQEIQTSATLRAATEIHKNINRATNLLLIHEQQDPHFSLVLEALLTLTQNQFYQGVVDSKAFAHLLDRLRSPEPYAQGVAKFQQALQELSQAPAEYLFLLFNKSVLEAPLALKNLGYNRLQFGLAHVLYGKNVVLRGKSIEPETLYKLILPFVRELESQIQKASHPSQTRDPLFEIQQITRNALELAPSIEEAPSNFSLRALTSIHKKASTQLSELLQKENAEMRAKVSKGVDTYEKELKRQSVRNLLKNALNIPNITHGPSMIFDTSVFSYSAIERSISGELVTLYSIPFVQKNAQGPQLASQMSPSNPDYENAVFILKEMLLHPSSPRIIWNSQVPKEILEIPGLTQTPFEIKSTILQISKSGSCRSFFTP